MSLLTVWVSRIEAIGQDTRLFVLSNAGSEPLPAVRPGAHIDVHVSATLVRQYSVLTPLSTPSDYVIAVQRAAAGRGGSRRLHDDFPVGSRLQIGAPRNHFELDESATQTLLLAGGIGITPIFGMFTRLQELKRKVHLHYWSRSPAHALFRSTLENHPDVTLRYSAPGQATLSLVLERVDPLCELYCCGPGRMLEEFERATKSRASQRLHVEHFSTPASEESGNDFHVVLAKSGAEVLVRHGDTILNALRNANVDVSYSCEEGLCGACEVRFLAGVPVHRDRVRTAAEHDRLSTVMICCAGSRTEQLTLDL